MSVNSNAGELGPGRAAKRGGLIRLLVGAANDLVAPVNFDGHKLSRP